jgi:hypothetical protein
MRPHLHTLDYRQVHRAAAEHLQAHLQFKLIFYSCASVFDVTPLLMGRESHLSQFHSATSLRNFPL